MRTKLVAGNWKMNNTVAQAAAAVETFVQHVDAKANVDVVICPPYLAIPKVRELLRNTHIKVGAQNVFWNEQGAFTGFVSPKMLDEFCVSHVIVGHSETRGRFGKLETPESTLGYFAETDETVNLKIRALLFRAMSPILCVGETLAERQAGETERVIQSQLEGAMKGLDASELFTFVVAYEPVWAIGTGVTCDTAEAERVCKFIRTRIGAMYDDELARQVRILYGGSVKSTNARELFSQPNIDGGLVGGASLDPQEFSLIVMSA
ncbi:MAG: triose-phosphate isomerase [Fimbriimonadaceae bacterium]|nr:triose-phosphate isomerase [Fimbriimonadaceae bacterium]